MNNMTLDKFKLVLSLVVTFIGLIVMAVWVFFQNCFELFPWIFVMVLNTAFCFTIAGVCCLIPERSHAKNIVRSIVSQIILIIAIASLYENLSGYSIGIDQIFISSKIKDGFHNPGRMSILTSLAFVFAGMILWLLPFIKDKNVKFSIHFIILLMILLSLAGLCGHYLNLNMLYDVTKYRTMAPHTAFAFILLSTIFWIKWYQLINKGKPESENGEVLRIVKASFKALSLVFLTCIVSTLVSTINF